MGLHEYGRSHWSWKAGALAGSGGGGVGAFTVSLRTLWWQMTKTELKLV